MFRQKQCKQTFMLRKSSFVLADVNVGKKASILKILEESKRVINTFIGIFWSQGKFSGKFPNSKTETFLSAKAQQALSVRWSDWFGT